MKLFFSSFFFFFFSRVLLSRGRRKAAAFSSDEEDHPFTAQAVADSTSRGALLNSEEHKNRNAGDDNFLNVDDPNNEVPSRSATAFRQDSTGAASTDALLQDNYPEGWDSERIERLERYRRRQQQEAGISDAVNEEVRQAQREGHADLDTWRTSQRRGNEFWAPVIKAWSVLKACGEGCKDCCRRRDPRIRQYWTWTWAICGRQYHCSVPCDPFCGLTDHFLVLPCLWKVFKTIGILLLFALCSMFILFAAMIFEHGAQYSIGNVMMMTWWTQCKSLDVFYDDIEKDYADTEAPFLNRSTANASATKYLFHTFLVLGLAPEAYQPVVRLGHDFNRSSMFALNTRAQRMTKFYAEPADPHTKKFKWRGDKNPFAGDYADNAWQIYSQPASLRVSSNIFWEFGERRQKHKNWRASVEMYVPSDLNVHDWGGCSMGYFIKDKGLNLTTETGKKLFENFPASYSYREKQAHGEPQHDIMPLGRGSPLLPYSPWYSLLAGNSFRNLSGYFVVGEGHKFNDYLKSNGVKPEYFAQVYRNNIRPALWGVAVNRGTSRLRFRKKKPRGRKLILRSSRRRMFGSRDGHPYHRRRIPTKFPKHIPFRPNSSWTRLSYLNFLTSVDRRIFRPIWLEQDIESADFVFVPGVPLIKFDGRVERYLVDQWWLTQVDNVDTATNYPWQTADTGRDGAIIDSSTPSIQAPGQDAYAVTLLSAFAEAMENDENLSVSYDTGWAKTERNSWTGAWNGGSPESLQGLLEGMMKNCCRESDWQHKDRWQIAEPPPLLLMKPDIHTEFLTQFAFPKNLTKNGTFAKNFTNKDIDIPHDKMTMKLRDAVKLHAKNMTGLSQYMESLLDKYGDYNVLLFFPGNLLDSHVKLDTAKECTWRYGLPFLQEYMMSFSPAQVGLTKRSEKLEDCLENKKDEQNGEQR